ncbi:MAG: amidase, partial [Quisquiliibacterium sp.]
MQGDEITDLDACELSDSIRKRQVSCLEVMTAYLTRIDRVNPGFNAIILRQPHERLLALAQ